MVGLMFFETTCLDMIMKIIKTSLFSYLLYTENLFASVVEIHLLSHRFFVIMEYCTNATDLFFKDAFLITQEQFQQCICPRMNGLNPEIDVCPG